MKTKGSRITYLDHRPRQRTQPFLLLKLAAYIVLFFLAGYGLVGLIGGHP